MNASPKPPWPIGLATLTGILFGALMGVIVEQVPVALTAGLAAGAGLDSLVNYWITQEREP